MQAFKYSCHKCYAIADQCTVSSISFFYVSCIIEALFIADNLKPTLNCHVLTLQIAKKILKIKNEFFPSIENQVSLLLRQFFN